LNSIKQSPTLDTINNSLSGIFHLTDSLSLFCKVTSLEPYVSKREHGAIGEFSEDRTLFLGLLRPQLMGTKGHRHTHNDSICFKQSPSFRWNVILSSPKAPTPSLSSSLPSHTRNMYTTPILKKKATFDAIKRKYSLWIRKTN